MEISQNGINFIKELEGCKLYSYDDVTGKEVKKGGICKGTLTIGIGHTKNVFAGQKITMQQAENFLKQDLSNVEKIVNEVVKVHLTQNQYDSLCSFAFNIGCDGFKSSTLLKLLNRGLYNQAAESFKNWHRGNGIPHVLDSRRKKEKELFLKK